MTLIFLPSLLTTWRSQHSDIDSSGSKPTKMTNWPHVDLDIWGCMNCNADQLAEKFQEWIDTGEVMPIDEGFFIKRMAVSVTVGCKQITSHVLHKIHLHIQGQKHWQYLQDKHSWDNTVWQSLNWRALKSAYLSLGWTSPMNQNIQDYSWVAQYWSPEIQDISWCCWLTQMSLPSGVQWNPGVHSHVPNIRARNVMTWYTQCSTRSCPTPSVQINNYLPPV
jgi:hypothetical protein